MEKCTCEPFTEVNGEDVVYQACAFCIEKLKEEQKLIPDLPF